MESKLLRALVTYLRGCLIGAADLVPGVSGGTIALLLGIYPRFIKALSQLGIKTLLDFFTMKKPAWWQHYDLSFLCLLFAGIVSAVFSLARLFDYLLTNQASRFYAFFLGLLLASCWQLMRDYAQARLLWWLGLIISAIFMLWFNSLPAGQAPAGVWLFFISGVFSIAVMLLPGISGSLMLLILGSYELLVRAVANIDIGTLLPYFIGVVSGFILFSRLYNRLFALYHQQAMAVFCGLIIGALLRIWPWQDEQGALYFPEQSSSYSVEAWLLLAGVLAVILPTRLGLLAPAKPT